MMCCKTSRERKGPGAEGHPGAVALPGRAPPYEKNSRAISTKAVMCGASHLLVW